MAEQTTRGAFVISLDFELHWGVRDRLGSKDSYGNSLLGARKAIPRMLDLFREFEIGTAKPTAAERAQIDSDGFSLLHVVIASNSCGCFDFALVALSIIEGEGMEFKSLLMGNCQDGGRVQTAG